MPTNRASFRTLGLALRPAITVWALSCPAFLSLNAQDAVTPGVYTRQELSVGLSSNPVGPTLRYDFNLSPSLALETRVSGFPQIDGLDQDVLQVVAGVKAGIRRGRWDFSGIIEPGWGLHPDQDIQYGYILIGSTPVLAPVVNRSILRSQFVLDTGVAAEYALTPRTFLRLDALTALEPRFDQTEYSSLTLGIISPGKVQSHGSVVLSAGHRFGPLVNEPDHATTPPRLEAGAFFSLYTRSNLLVQQMNADSGYGGWVSDRVASHLDLEAVALRYPHDDQTSNYQDGGKQSLVLAGFKSGFRHDRLGLFFKARGGAIRFSSTFSGSVFSTYQDYFSASPHATWQPALDLGGVVEVYPVRHLVLRAEAGPTLLFYRATTFTITGQSNAIPASQAASMLLLFGAGFRF